MDAFPVGSERFFDRLRSGVLKSEEWTAVESPECGLSLSRLETSPGTSLFRIEHSIDAPLADIAAMSRPEAFFHQSRLDFDQELGGMLHCDIEHVFAPGDICARLRLRFTPMLQRNISLMGTPCLQGGGNADSDPWSAAHRVRVIMRRDFPEAGQFAVIFAPMHPETGELVEEWAGILRAMAYLVEPHPDDPHKTRSTEVKQLTRVPTWALQLGLDSPLRRMKYGTAFRASPVFKVVTGGLTSYVVVGLRKCERGPPMLPCHGASLAHEDLSGWRQAETHGFAFAQYLRTFLDRLGVDVRIHESLDGRGLMPYQAAVQRGEWEHAWSILAGPFKVQRAAYRRALGGARAPELAIDVAPRFLPLAASPKPTMEAPVKRRGPRVPVFKTFVHFSDGPALPEIQRCGSNPALRTAREVTAC